VNYLIIIKTYHSSYKPHFRFKIKLQNTTLQPTVNIPKPNFLLPTYLLIGLELSFILGQILYKISMVTFYIMHNCDVCR